MASNEFAHLFWSSSSLPGDHYAFIYSMYFNKIQSLLFKNYIILSGQLELLWIGSWVLSIQPMNLWYIHSFGFSKIFQPYLVHVLTHICNQSFKKCWYFQYGMSFRDYNLGIRGCYWSWFLIVLGLSKKYRNSI